MVTFILISGSDKKKKLQFKKRKLWIVIYAYNAMLCILNSKE